MEQQPDPTEGRNPFLGMEIQQLAERIDLVNQQLLQTGSPMLRGALEQNKGWLTEALYVEIAWNRSKNV